jgi:hypothetical protein
VTCHTSISVVADLWPKIRTLIEAAAGASLRYLPPAPILPGSVTRAVCVCANLWLADRFARHAAPRAPRSRADDLQADRQAIGGEAVGDRHGAQVEQISEAREMRWLCGLIDFLDWDRYRMQRRRQHRIHPGEHRIEVAFPALRGQVLSGCNVSPGQDPRSDDLRPDATGRPRRRHRARNRLPR